MTWAFVLVALIGASEVPIARPIPIDDVDGDRRSDLVVVTADAAHSIIAVSSRGDHALWSHARLADVRAPPDVVACGDVDGDRVRDLAALWMVARSESEDERALLVLISSRTGHALRSTTLTLGASREALAFAATGDLDGDGRSDLLIGVSEALDGAGVVHAVSGSDLSMREFARGNRGDRLGAALARLGDVDRDGTEDVAVGSAGPDDTIPGEVHHGSEDARRRGGWISIVSGRTGITTLTVHGDDERACDIGRRFAAAPSSDSCASNLWIVRSAEHGRETEAVLVSTRSAEVIERVRIADVDAWDMLYLRPATGTATASAICSSAIRSGTSSRHAAESSSPTSVTCA